MNAYVFRVPDYQQTGMDDEDYHTAHAPTEDYARAAVARLCGLDNPDDLAMVAKVDGSVPHRVAIAVEGGVVMDVVGADEYQIVDYDDLRAEGEDDEAQDSAWREACRWTGQPVDELEGGAA